MNSLPSILNEHGDQTGVIDFFDANKQEQMVQFKAFLDAKQKRLLDQKSGLGEQVAKSLKNIDNQIAEIEAVRAEID